MAAPPKDGGVTISAAPAVAQERPAPAGDLVPLARPEPRVEERVLAAAGLLAGRRR